jgi:hypothetical protein
MKYLATVERTADGSGSVEPLALNRAAHEDRPIVLVRGFFLLPGPAH